MAFEGSYNIGTTFKAVSALLKEYYLSTDKNRLNQLMYTDSFLQAIQKLPASHVVQGKKIILPVQIGEEPSQSKTFSDAQQSSKERTDATGVFSADID